MKLKPLIIDKLELPLVKHPEWTSKLSPEGFSPHPFQIGVLEGTRHLMKNGGGIIKLDMPTGSGKTRAAMTPSIMDGYNTLCIYPTNSLIDDQLKQMMNNLGLDSNSFEDSDLIQVNNILKIKKVTGESLRKHKFECGFKTKGRSLLDIFDENDMEAIFPNMKRGNTIILTNPDILHILKHGLYMASKRTLLNLISSIDIVMFDEFHMYDAKQAASMAYFIRFLIHESQKEKSSIVIIISTATMSNVADDILKGIPQLKITSEQQIPNEIKIILEETPESPRVVLSPLKLWVDECDDWGGSEWLFNNWNNLPKGFEDNAVYIFDSIADSRTAYEMLSSKIGEDNVGLVIGSIDTESRKKEIKKKIVVGNNAIRVGIDFKKENAVIYSRDFRSAIQGIGRVGRGNVSESNVILLLSHEAYTKYSNFRNKYNGEHITRIIFNKLLKVIHPEYEDFAQYIKKYAPIEAYLAGASTWTDEKLLLNVFNINSEDIYRKVEKLTASQKDVLRKYRGEWDYSVAVYDETMAKKNYCPYRLEDPYRALKYAKVKNMFKKNEFYKLVKDEFIEELEERSKFILGFAKIEWLDKPRKGVTFLPVDKSISFLEENSEQLHDIKWIIKCGDFIDGGTKLATYMSQSLSEDKIVSFPFKPSKFYDKNPLPHLFRTYSIKDTDLQIALGGNALLMDAIFND